MSSRIAFGSFTRALLVYRIFAFATGTVLLASTIGLILQVQGIGPLWLVHGYLFMAYALVAGNLAMHMRLSPLKAIALVAAGTIPTMSFVAERAVCHRAAASPSHNLAVNKSDS